MLRKLAVAAAVSLIAAAIPGGAMAAHGGGGGGHGGGGFGGGHGFSGGGFGGRSFRPGFAPRGMPGGNALVNRGVTGQPFVNRGVVGQRFVNRGVPATAPLAGRYVTGNGRFAWNGHHRIHGRHIHGFIPGFGYGYYWYYGDCWAWTDDGWVNICVDLDDYPAP
jgi:hypothetical protein